MDSHPTQPITSKFCCNQDNKHVSGPFSIALVVITYEPASHALGTFEKLIQSVRCRLIIDNSERDEDRSLVATVAQRTNTNLIANPRNMGIGTAINQAIAWADNLNITWLLFFDQDTKLTRPDPLIPYLDILYHDQDSKNVAGIGLVTSSDHRSQEGAIETDALITSGCFLRVSALRQVGGAWEELFIDGVDIELCWRLRTYEWRLIAINHPGIQHSIGTGRPVQIFGRDLFVTDHPPIRRFYSARNRILIAQRHKVSVRWYLLIRDDIVALLFEYNRFRKLLAVLLGVWHGLNGTSGRWDDPYSLTRIRSNRAPST